MGIQKYIDINGSVLYCNTIDNTNSDIVCFNKDDDDVTYCSTAVQFPDGCGYGIGYNTRYNYTRYFKTEYDVPEEITCTYSTIKGSFRNYFYADGVSWWGGNWWQYWYGFIGCSSHLNSWGGARLSYGTRLSQAKGYFFRGLWTGDDQVYPDLGRCSESPDELNVYSRLANCKTARCVPLNLNTMDHKCDAINSERELDRCCVSSSCSDDNSCRSEASRIEKTYSVSYEIVKPGFYCLEELPELSETTCDNPWFASSQVFLHHTSCEYFGTDDCTPENTGEKIIHYGCAGTIDRCPAGSPGGSFSLIAKEICSRSYTFQTKDCGCQCASCVNCSSFESDSCMYGLDSGYYYNYNFGYVGLIGSDCCSSFGSYGNWDWWWRGYSLCPSNDGPNSIFVFDAGSNTCSRQDAGTNVEPPNINYGTARTACFGREDPFDRKCIPPYPNWVIINACDTETIEDYTNRDCYERGPDFSRTVSYNKIINSTTVSQNRDKCLPDPDTNPDPDTPPPATVEYASFKPIYCEQEPVQLTNYKLIYAKDVPTNLRDWRACIQTPEFAVVGCVFPECEPAEDICYTDKSTLVLYSLVYKPEEILGTVEAKVTITYCQMSIVKC